MFNFFWKYKRPVLGLDVSDVKEKEKDPNMTIFIKWIWKTVRVHFTWWFFEIKKLIYVRNEYNHYVFIDSNKKAYNVYKDRYTAFYEQKK